MNPLDVFPGIQGFTVIKVKISKNHTHYRVFLNAANTVREKILPHGVRCIKKHPVVGMFSSQKGFPGPQNQRIRPYFSFTFCRSRSPESFGPVLAPKFAPRPPTKPERTSRQADKQTDAEPENRP